MKVYHTPRDFPICDCGVPAKSHYVEHIYRGTGNIVPCHCGLFETNHRKNRSDRDRGRKRKPKIRTNKQVDKFIGIDGEGAEQLLPDGSTTHNYFMLAASYEDGSNTWVVEPEAGKHRLSTVQCLDMILELPHRRTKIFSFAFNYDLTKILTDVDDLTLFLLFRPELRHRAAVDAFKGPYPVKWGEYLLNLQGTKFTVRRGKKRIVIWDLFKFFQGKFVTALRDWKIGDKELWDRMQKMKDQRRYFNAADRDKILEYCLEETRCMGQLARKLLDSHRSQDLELRAYYGAGSSGAAMLTTMDIRSKIAKPLPAMEHAVASAFFGGRFENSVIGDIKESLTNWDISSAYVYQLAFLPCLEHATWEHTKRRKDIETAEGQNCALVHYELGSNASKTGWGPFPFRTPDGTIAFPIESGGGWVWLDEYLMGEKMFPHVQFKEAWVYKKNCDCKPFKKIPEYYVHRLKLGKEGPGLVIKLGMNSCYGKLAQSVGNALFNSWIWAGMITSGTRAQLLELMALHKDRENVLMLATDGLLTRETIVPPKPLPTGTDMFFPEETSHGVIVQKSKPLGGWEKKTANKGMFIARPGIYFPLNPTEEEIGAVRARGVGRSIVLKYWQQIVDVWAKDGITGVAVVDKVPRFCGAKTCISISKKGCNRAKHKDGIRPSYGQWIAREVGMSFDPLPKREGLHKDGLRLILRRFPKAMKSTPYDRAVGMQSPEAKLLREAAQEMLEQPEGDLLDSPILQGFE